MFEKPKHHPQTFISPRVFMLALVMLLSGVLIGGMAMFLVAPTLYSLPATQALLGTERARLALAAQTLTAEVAVVEGIATRSAQDLQGTRSAQDSRAQQTALALQGTAAEGLRAIYATQTAAALLSAQQLTRIALDYASTQAALSQNATQVQLNFDATRAVLGTPAAVPPRPTLTMPSSTSTPGVGFSDSFRELASTRYRYSAREAFAVTDAGLRVEREGWLLTRDYIDGAWTLELLFQPALAASAQYDVLLNVAVNDGYLLRVTADGLTARNASLARFSGGLPPVQLAPTAVANAVDVLLVGESRLLLRYANNTLRATLNDTLILEGGITFTSAGALGVQLPQGTLLKRLTLTAP